MSRVYRTDTSLVLAESGIDALPLGEDQAQSRAAASA